MGEKPKFKVGDRVRVIKSVRVGQEELVGRAFTVEYHISGNSGFEWSLAEEANWNWRSEQLELISKAPSKAILNKYHFFHSESNPLDIQRIADENPEAIGGVVLVKGGDGAVVWLRDSFLEKFEGEVKVWSEALSDEWGWKVEMVLKSDRIFYDANGFFSGIRRMWIPSEEVQQTISEIKAAKKFLADKEANMKKAGEEKKEETKVKPKEPRTKITVLTF